MRFSSLSRSGRDPSFYPLPPRGQERVIALVPAYNEEESIAAALGGLLLQTRRLDEIIVIANNCTDRTVEIASQFESVTLIDMTIRGSHKKSRALNHAWRHHASDADIVICQDADTVLPSNAVQDWIGEFQDDPELGGSSSKATFLGRGLLTALQRAEFSRWTDACLRRGWTSVLVGAGSAIRSAVLHEVVERFEREGPWAYTSHVEDFELTHRVRDLGFHCTVSPTVRSYTAAMTTVRSLWAQRMKWQTGILSDLLTMGVRRTTVLDWVQQFAGFIFGLVRFLWLFTFLLAVCTTHFRAQWWVFLPAVIFAANDVKHATRIPHRSRRDIFFAAILLPREFYIWMRTCWFLCSWREFLWSLITKKQKDRWHMQYAAEAARKTPAKGQ